LIGCEIGKCGGDILNIKNNNIRRAVKGIYIDILQPKTNKSVTVGIVAPYFLKIVENNLTKEIQHQKLNDYLKFIYKLASITEVVKGTKLNTETNHKELGKYPSMT
jgi:sRNA-binding carbon storage regulator CsrA